VRRAVPAPPAHLLDRGRLALEEGLHGSVGAVRHPSGHTARLSLTSAAVTEEDPLYAAADDDSAGHDRHIVNVLERRISPDQASRRSTLNHATPTNTAASVTKPVNSTHWNGQYRLAGW